MMMLVFDQKRRVENRLRGHLQYRLEDRLADRARLQERFYGAVFSVLRSQ